MTEKFLVVGAGPVGSLAALYAAVRGYRVEVYEFRPDLRDPTTTPLNFTKSMNLGLSERGIVSLQDAGLPELVDAVYNETVPMHGRMLHTRKKGKLVREPQLYDVRGKHLLAMDRTVLNTTLLDCLETMPNVTLHFSHKLTGIDFKKRLAWFERHTSSDPQGGTEIEVRFDFMIGADGAHSAVRYHLMKFVPMTYHQEYIDKLWCQFHIPAAARGGFRLPSNYLHIWPEDDAMFIAVPNLDKTFTATLFLTKATFEHLDESDDVVPYFETQFPGVVPDLITKVELRRQYRTNPHIPLVSIKCGPYHFASAGVIVGDAAHAMVPFYGQGMNTGFEDVRILYEFLDRHPRDRARALAEYSKQRIPDAHTINDLAFANYYEMATNVKSPNYRIRKWLEETLDLYLPSMGWTTQYSRVTFSSMRFSEVQRRSRNQALVLNCLVGVTSTIVVGSSVFLARSGIAKRWETAALKGMHWVVRQAQQLFTG